MASVYDRGDRWELVIAPEATPVEEIDEPDKGYHATLGQLPDGRHVVMNVLYNKDRFSVQDVLEKVDNLRNCSRCQTLDKERLKLDKIEVPSSPAPTPAPQQQAQGFQTPPPAPTPTPTPSPQNKVRNVKDWFGTVFLDAYLTPAGKYFLGIMLDDDQLLESAIPENPQEIPDFMDNVLDFLSGKTDFVRDAEEVREYFDAMRSNKDSSDEESRSSRARKKKSSSQGIVIY